FTLLIYEFIHNDTSTAEIYSLSLHDALPILEGGGRLGAVRPQGRRDHRRGERGAHRADHGHRDRGRAARAAAVPGPDLEDGGVKDRKSTRLNSSHVKISYAVFCLKKKKQPTK